MNKVITLGGVITLSVIIFALWRNYGVKPKGVVILDAENKTNEQKELVNKIKEINPKDDELKTSFGYYKKSNGNWIKTNEIWEK